MASSNGQTWSEYRGGPIARIAQLLMTRYVDRFHPAAMLTGFFGQPEVLETFRLINGSSGIAEAIIRWYGPIRATGDGFYKNDGFIKDPDYSGPTPAEIVKPLRAVKQEEQRMALRYVAYIERSSTVDETGSPLAETAGNEATGAIRSWGERNAWARQFAREWKALCEAMLPFYKDMHYIEAGELDGLENPSLPLMRPVRDYLGDLDRSPTTDLADLDVADALLGSLASNVHRAIRANALYTLGMQCIGWDEILREDYTDDVYDHRQPHEVYRIRDPAGPTLFVASDPLVQLMIESLHREPPGRFLAFMIGVKNVVAALITADPTFVMRNSTRDTLSAFVLGRAWMVPVVDTLRGTGAFSISDESARQWFLQGGASSTLLETAADDLEDATPTMPLLATTSRLKRIARVCRRGYYFVTTPARALEAGTRIMQFRRMLNTGATPRQAALASRAVSTDFANRGAADDWVTFVIRTTVFLNAAIQGLNETRKVALTRSGMGGKTGFWGETAPKFWKAGFLGLTTLSLIAWYHSTSRSQNLEEYEALTTYHKSAYVHFTGIPGFQGHLRIPVPFEVGFLFQKLPEMVFDAVAGVDTSDTDPAVPGILPPTARHMLQTSFLLSGVPIPTAISPMFDHLRNRNFFGGEIVPYYMMRRPAPARHFRSTPSSYVYVGELLDLSPLVVKHYFEGYGGNVARNVTVAVESLVWDEVRLGPKAFPSGGLRATGMSAFSASPFRSRSRWADDYYTLAEVVEDTCFMARRYEGQRRRAYVEENRSILRLCDWKRDADKALRPFGRTVHENGFVNPSASRSEKERYIERAYRRRDEIYRRAYISARDFLRAQE